MNKKIAILTSGGDSPGMNNSIRAIVNSATINGMESFLVIDGYKGLFNDWIKPSTDFDINQYNSKGGTFIGSARFPEFKKPEVRAKAKANLEARGIEALIVIGGDGSYIGAQLLHDIGVKTIALPGTIDNDISSSDETIGYPTALETIVDSVEKVRDTMNSHNRAAIIQVMGHGCADLALFGGMATGAEIIITNDNKLTEKEVGAQVKKLFDAKRRSVIILVSEFVFKDLDVLAKTVEKESGYITRAMSLEHLQRGGVPTAWERINATQMGIKAVDLLLEGKSGEAVGKINGEFVSNPIEKALSMPRADRKKLIETINKINKV